MSTRFRKAFWSCTAAALWWLLDRLYGDAIFAWLKPSMPDWLTDPPIWSWLDFAASYVPPAILVALGLFFYLSGRRQIANLANGPLAGVGAPSGPVLPPVTVLQHDSQPFTAPRGLPEPVKQIPATDKERLDLALYETFDAIAKLAMPPYNDARYLTGNWETKLIDASARRELFAEIRAIRAKYVKFAQRMHHIVFNDYYYYIDELRDGVLRGGAYPEIAGALDKLQTAIQAVPEPPVELNTVRLITPQVKEFDRSVEAAGRWFHETQELIRRKRTELSQ